MAKGSDILQGAATGAVNLAGGFLGSKIGSNRAKAARAWTKRRYAERYQVTVRDMRAAGLNPILAAQGALGQVGGMSGASPAQTPDFTRAGDTMTNARKAPSEVARNRGQAALTKKQLDFIDAQIIKETSISNMNDAMTAKHWQDIDIKTPFGDLGRGVGAGTTPLADKFISNSANSAKGLGYLWEAIRGAASGNPGTFKQIIQGRGRTNGSQGYRRNQTKRVGASGRY